MSAERIAYSKELSRPQGLKVTPENSVVPSVDGIISKDQVLETAHSIAVLQRDNGMIPWFDGGHSDPWNHVEAAMALCVCGTTAAAEKAYEWLANMQLPDGSWFNYYLDHGVKDARLDTNVCAYIATGLWHHHLITGNQDLLRRLWSTVENAIDFVLRWQKPDGSVLWSLDPSGRAEGYALLTGSSSIYHSLRCAVAIAELLGKDRPDWELAAGRLGHAVAHHPSAFAPKVEFAMDWYYPMLAGALEGQAGRKRMAESWDTFVLPGKGVRCVSTNDWITAAETAECVMALDALGLREMAFEVFTMAQHLRLEDGTYWTGLVYPDQVSFPDGERTTYTAAAIILAADALSTSSPAAGLFRGECIPQGLDFADSQCCSGEEQFGCTAVVSPQ